VFIFTTTLYCDVRENAYFACSTLVAKENITPSCIRDTGRRSYNKEKEVILDTNRRHDGEVEYDYVNITARGKARKLI
jgi:hypothetical protein